MNKKIDIIITWVDDKDNEWKEEKKRFIESNEIKNKIVDTNIRFESWDNLQYWFRAIEKFMPWVNNVFFVTWGHVPAFLNINHPKLRIVKHSDYILKKYLPTYNSNTIEMNLYKIEQLSENFVLFNDDMFPLQPIANDYYFKGDIVCDEAIENIITTATFGPVSNMARYTQVNNMFIINKYFKKREVQSIHWDKWYCEDYGERLERTKSLMYWNDFPGFYDPHLPSAMKKSIIKKIWELESDVLDNASCNHFRAYSDVSQYLVRYWQLCEGNFFPRRTQGKVFFVDIYNYKFIADTIRKQNQQMICLNENCTSQEFEVIKQEINAAFEKILPQKCSFEI